MAAASEYPPIDPTAFDLIVVGTGLPGSVLSAAASAAGKSVLHLDPHPFYGGHFSSLPLHELTSFLQSNGPDSSTSDHHPNGGSDYDAVELATCPVYTGVEITSYCDDVLEDSRRFSLDLGGPRVLFCAGSAVELLLKSGANRYVEFKNIDVSLYCDGSGRLRAVPDSKSAVFKDKELSFYEKNRLNTLFKLVQGHLEAVAGLGEDRNRISDDDLESPFAEFLDKMQLPQQIKSIILYAIALADYDQDNAEVCKDVLKTKDGVDRLALYHASVGRFTNANGALIYPIYGQGELPQAFCRRAAVKGCLYVLRMPVTTLLMDKGSGKYMGVKLASGQEITSHKLVMDPTFRISSPMTNVSSEFLQYSYVPGEGGVQGKLARAICITKSSLKPDVSNCLVTYPPKCLYSEQVTSIRVLQLGSNLAVCPPGMFVVYISTYCEDAVKGKESLHAVIYTIFSVHISGSEIISTVQDENLNMRPVLLWSALYIQESPECSLGPVISTPMPDGKLNYDDIVVTATKLFRNLYPDEEFFPPTSLSDNTEDDIEHE